MDMLSGAQITAAKLTDWRKLGQALHARFVIGDLRAGARFVTAISEVGEAGGHLEVRMRTRHVDLKVISDDVIYRDDAGTQHQVEWVTRHDVDLARRITEIAAQLSLVADPRSITTVELALDTADAANLAPVWSALLTGGPRAGHDRRRRARCDRPDAHPLVPRSRSAPHSTPEVPHRHPGAVRRRRATYRRRSRRGAVVVDDSRVPGTTVLADPEGNKACVGTFQPAT